ncbi:unnamed protein product [Rhizoctonia solani]|uniref:FAS1 domain-containing protein n=1 Tax=Rhizoctonia solani TaxID=456999 RepID=A0A8H3BKP3_9AGAM|nr:unnamed protein product [Rhizoctonia solani]
MTELSHLSTMKFLSRVVPKLLVASSAVKAASIALRNNDGFFSEFIAALNENNLTTLADSYEKIAETKEGGQVIDFLENKGELTLLAPENRAFDDNSIINPDVLLYNTVQGNIDKDFRTTDHYFVRRRSRQSRDVVETAQQFPPSNSLRKRTESSQDFQVQVIDQFVTDSGRKRTNDRLILIDRAVGNAKVIRRFNFKQIVVLIIDTVLTLLAKVSDLLYKPLIKSAPNGLVKFRGALQKAGLLDTVDTQGGRITLFAPVDDEFCDIEKFSKDELSSFLKNHFFFGKIVYSPLFTSVRKATAKSGKQLELSYENDIHYVRCGKDKAVVLRSDVISSNGVVHVIDRPLKCD